jgi:hypothetical protein
MLVWLGTTLAAIAVILCGVSRGRAMIFDGLLIGWLGLLLMAVKLPQQTSVAWGLLVLGGIGLAAVAFGTDANQSVRLPGDDLCEREGESAPAARPSSVWIGRFVVFASRSTQEPPR